MKAVLISIQPKWCNLIAQKKKTVEVRKTKPKLETPFKCYIYMTEKEFVARKEDGEWWFNVRKSLIKPIGSVELSGKVIGEFVCDKIEKFTVGGLRCDDIEVEACLTYEEMIAYFYKPEELDGKHAKFGYCWHISDLKIYDKPKELGEFKKACGLGTGCEDCDDIYFTNCKNALTRPPQSWCYVEELE